MYTDAVIVTEHCAFENDPWILKLVEFAKKVLHAKRLRAVGVCFGHQILGRALDAPVVKNSEWEISVSKVDLSSKGKELFGKDDLVSTLRLLKGSAAYFMPSISIRCTEISYKYCRTASKHLAPRLYARSKACTRPGG